MVNPELQEDKVIVWNFDLQTLLPGSTQLGLFLSSDEQRRASQYIRTRDRISFITRRALLKVLLHHYTQIPLERLSLSANEHGRLFLAGAPLSFNLSVCWPRLVIAFGPKVPLGIDIEREDPLPEMHLMVDHWFSMCEKRAWELVPDLDRTGYFYRIWTQKEAYLKARGVGLSRAPQDISVSADPTRPGVVDPDDQSSPDHWKTWCIQEGPYRVAVCTGSQNKLNITILNVDTCHEQILHLLDLPENHQFVTHRNEQGEPHHESRKVQDPSSPLPQAV